MHSYIIKNWTETERQHLKLAFALKFRRARARGIPAYQSFYDTLSSTGLYITLDGRFLRCYCCALKIPLGMAWFAEHHDCLEGLNGLAEIHQTYSSSCYYVNGYIKDFDPQLDGDLIIFNRIPFNQRTIPSQPTFTDRELTGYIDEEFGPPGVTISDGNLLNPMMIYKLLQFRENRKYSFSNSCLSEEKKNQMVDDGLYYVGYHNVIQCAYCHIAFKYNEKMSPHDVHIYLNPKCIYLSKEQTDNDELCCCCLSENANVLYLPCNHFNVCKKCDKRLKKRKSPVRCVEMK